MRPSVLCLLCLGALPAAVAFAGPPHQHGAATLDVVIAQGRLSVALRSPLDNLLGFEHAPRNEKQRRAVAGMEERLRDGIRQFRPAAAAGCVLQGATLRHPYAAPREPAPPGAARRDELHAEIDAGWEFACRDVEALGRIDVRLFDDFPGIQRLKVRLVSPRGQRGATLTPGNGVLVW